MVEYGPWRLTPVGTWERVKPKSLLGVAGVGSNKIIYLMLAGTLFAILLILFGQIFLVVGLLLLASTFFVPMPWNWRIMLLLSGLVFIWLGLAL